jgi:hypothetical protein
VLHNGAAGVALAWAVVDGLTTRKEIAMANQPTLYELSGHGIQVTYTTSSIQGKLLFNYHDTVQAKSFSGDQIQTVDTILGKLVTVFLVQTPDSGSTTFTLLVPNVNLPPSRVATVVTEGITTLHKFTIVGPPQGQTEFYTVHRLHGVARFVEF